MFTRIVSAVSPADLVQLYEMLSCFLASMGHLSHGGPAGREGAAAFGPSSLDGPAMRELARSAANACISGLQARAAGAASGSLRNASGAASDG